MDSRTLLADWASTKWLWWAALYLAWGLVLPWAMTRVWADQHRSKVSANLMQIFQHGELGLIALVLAISVIWDLQRSNYSAECITVGSIFMAVGGIMAVSVWVESQCRRLAGEPDNSKRAWHDSLGLALFLFSVALGVEILLDRFTKVINP